MNRQQRRAQKRQPTPAGPVLQRAGPVDLNRLLSAALARHRAGDLAHAEQLYRQILGQAPNQAEVLNLLGVLTNQTGRPEVAFQYLGRAVQLQPASAPVHGNLGLALLALGRSDEGRASLRRALELDPGYHSARFNLGLALRASGQLEAAADCFIGVLERLPEAVEALDALGETRLGLGQAAEAEALHRRALSLQPDSPISHNNLGNALQAQGQLEAAVEAYRAALTQRPDFPEASNNLGSALQHLNRLEEALEHFEAASLLRAAFAEPRNNGGAALVGLGRLSDGVAWLRQAVELRPGYAEAWNNLGGALLSQGEIDEGLSCLQRAVEVRGGFPEAASALIFGMHYRARYDPATLADQARQWGHRYAPPLERPPDHPNQPDPDRRLRVGYVSADLHRHPVGYFLEQVLACHSSAAVESFCYSNNGYQDDLTARLQRHADNWREIRLLPDPAVAELIHQDRIDLLIDLGGHSARARLALFGLQPAPVQASWLGYFDTTGLSAIDYLIADRYVAPAGVDQHYVEQIIRLEGHYLCYQPPREAPPVADPPVSRVGRLTFGCFNNLAKLSPETVAIWARLLERLPEARLLLMATAFDDRAVRERQRAGFAAHGLDPNRLELRGRAPYSEYLRSYSEVDIALDPFPYPGGTTTAEALWMGVPVVSLAGQTFVSRMGLTYATAAGLADLVSDSPGRYLEVALELASDLPRLAALRRALRPRLRASALCDGPGFTRELEAAFRSIWRAWCARAA